MHWKQWLLVTCVAGMMSIPVGAQTVHTPAGDMVVPDSVTMFNYQDSMFYPGQDNYALPPTVEGKTQAFANNKDWTVLQIQAPTSNGLATGVVVMAKLSPEQVVNYINQMESAATGVNVTALGNSGMTKKVWKEMPLESKSMLLQVVMKLPLDQMLQNLGETGKLFLHDENVEVGNWDNPGNALITAKGNSSCLVGRSMRLYVDVDGAKLSEFVTPVFYVQNDGSVAVMVLLTSDIERHTIEPLWESMVRSLVK